MILLLPRKMSLGDGMASSCDHFPHLCKPLATPQPPCDCGGPLLPPLSLWAFYFLPESFLTVWISWADSKADLGRGWGHTLAEGACSVHATQGGFLRLASGV